MSVPLMNISASECVGINSSAQSTSDHIKHRLSSLLRSHDA